MYPIIGFVAAIVIIILIIYIIIIIYGKKGYRKVEPLLFSRFIKPFMERVLVAMASKGTLSWHAALNVLERLGTPKLAHLLVVRGACPSNEDMIRIRELGYYELLTGLYSRGCSISGNLIEEAITFHVLAGQKSYARAAGYVSPKPGLAVIYCGEELIEVWDGAKTYSSRTLSRGAFERLKILASPEAIKATINPGFLISWGCRDEWDAREFIGMAFPEVPPSITALSYHLGLNGSRAEIIAKAFSTAVKIFEKSGALPYTGLPSWITTLVDEEVSCKIEKGLVVITDRPKAGCPLWTPEVIKVREGPPEEVNPRAWASILSLAYRRGDHSSVKESWSWSSDLVKLIPYYLHKADEPPSEGGFQIKPEYVASIRISKYNIAYDCLRPTRYCAKLAGLSPPEEIIAKPKVLALSPVLRGPVEPVKAASKEWGGGPTLYIVPSKAMARVASQTLDIKLIENYNDIDDWPLQSTDAVTSWKTVTEQPWIIENAPRIVLVYPEVFPGKPIGISEVVDWVRGLSSHVSRFLVSRLAYYQDAELVGTGDLEPIAPESISKDLLMVEAQEVFSEYWEGYNIRPYQKTAIAAVAEMIASRPSQPVYIILPTGSGKSAIFQIAGILAKRMGYGGYILVISPLRALMRDQVESARKRGFTAERIDATVSGRRKKMIITAARMGALDLLYVTPERFMDEDFTKLLAESPPALVVLDEAHTLARWGPSFRPSYLHAAKTLADLRQADDWPPIALFTATAPPDVVESSLASVNSRPGIIIPMDLTREISYEFPDEGALVFRGPVVRPELFFEVKPAPKDIERVDVAGRTIRELASWSNEIEKSWIGIVYTGFVKRTRKEWENADSLAELLSAKTGLRTVSYHGQLSPRERRLRENMIYEASQGKGPLIVVATKAFGMGVDIPNIRWVLHFTASDSIEDYYQEAGRAGRDGREARIVALYNPVDFDERIRMVRAQRTTPSSVAFAYNTLLALWRKLREETGGSPTLVIPSSLLHPDPLSLKAVSMLQRLGYIDYWGVRVPLAAYRFEKGHDPADYLPWYMDLGKGVVVGPRDNLSGIAETIPLRFYRCSSVAERYRPLKIQAGDRLVSIGECKEFIPMDNGKNATILVVHLSLDRGHDLVEYFPYNEYRLLVSSMWQEEEKVEALHRLMEKALEASRKSPTAVNAVIREGLEDYFSRPMLSPLPDPPSGLLGRREACPTLQECIEAVVDTIDLAVEWIGDKGVTLAVQEEEWIPVIIRRYTAKTGRPFRGRYQGSYNRIVAATRKGWIHLMDYGFIVAVVRGSGRPSVLIERMREYPYSALFIYNKA